MREIKRQLIHLIFGLLLLIIVLQLNEFNFFVFSFIILVSLVAVSFFLKTQKKNFLLKIIMQVERVNEKHLPGFGAIMFFLGFFLLATFNLVFHNKNIIVFALIPLIIGDAFSTVIGSKFGKIKIMKNKTLEGSLAFIISSFIVLYLFQPEKIILAGIISVSGALIELLPLNDNLSIPIGLTLISSILMSFL